MADEFFYLKSDRGGLITRGAQNVALGEVLPRQGNNRSDGIFAQWSWNGREFTLINDRYGIFPVFYYWRFNELCVSSSIPTILSQISKQELDCQALAVFFRLGFFLKDDTPFKHIKAVPPGATLCWKENQLSIEGGRFVLNPKPISLPKAIEQYRELFRQALRRRKPEAEFIVPLSGGRDSRLILYELVQMGYHPKFCLSTLRYPPYGDNDIDLATVVAQSLGLPHMIKYHERRRINNELRCFRLCSFCSDEHTWYLDALDSARNEADIIYDGIGGDITALVARYPHHEGLMREKKFGELAQELFGIWGMAQEEGLKGLLHPEVFGRASYENALDCLRDELASHSQAINPAASFYFWNRTRREISLCPYRVAGFSKVFSPYLDDDFFDFHASLPLELARDRTLQSAVIQTTYPQYTHIPFDGEKVRYDTQEHYVGFMRDIASHTLRQFKISSELINMRYVFPRLVKAITNRKYCQDLVARVPPLVLLYLLELEKEMNKPCQR